MGEARGYFTLGNHDWDQGEEHGWAQRKYPGGPLAHCTPPAGEGRLLPIVDAAEH
jgi:hypothetical protein